MNRQFTALSGLAMLLIVLNHTIELGTKVPVSHGVPPLQGELQAVLRILQGLGVFAVPAFLFISGAFVCYAARGVPPKLTARFLLNSLNHIWWPYLLWSIIFYVVVLFQFGERFTPVGYIRNLLVGYPFHFIPLLLLFYVLAPPLVRIAGTHPTLVVAAIGIGQLFLMTLIHTQVFPKSMMVLVPPVVGRTFADWAIYFPLGLVYGLHMKTMLPQLRRIKWLLLGSTAVLFILGAMHWQRLLDLPLASYLSPIPLVLLLPVIDRSSIPAVASLEGVGKRSYGLYLTHLLVLDLVLLAIWLTGPRLLQYQLLLLPLLFALALKIPLFLMNTLARSRARTIYRYVLG